MRETKILLVIMGLLLSIFLVACGDDAGTEEADGEEETDTEGEAEGTEEEEAEEEEAEMSVPEDEELFEVLDRNITTMEEDDLKAHMETLHSESPGFAETEQIMEDMAVYTLDIQVSDMEVEEKSEEEARVFYKQTNIKVDGPEYENNEITGVHVMRPEDGAWKIYDTELVDYVVVDENGEPLEEDAAGEVVMEGEYADAVSGLNMPFDEDEWVLAHYGEDMGEAIAEFLVPGENVEDYTELLTIHYFPGGKDEIGVAQFSDVMETNLTEMIEGNFEFDRFDETEEEGFYEFGVAEDPMQFDQEELARVFVKDEDLFAVRYTLIEDTVEDREGWIETLSDIE
ncbi:hypothetical protein ACDX78_05050 [Virgibacillus oceani]